MSIDIAVAAALISGAFALILAGFTAFLTGREQQRNRRWQDEQEARQQARQAEMDRELTKLSHDLERSAKEEDRSVESQKQLDRFREPLLTVTHELQNRIDNIRTQGFLSYLKSADTHRARLARLSTAYRFGRYWGVVNALYDSVDPVRFETDTATRAVSAALDSIGKTFADDRHDARRFMVWREEQRAIADLMAAPSATTATKTVGFSTFVEQFDDRFRTWFTTFLDDFDTPGAERSHRLELVEEHLVHLIDLLEQGRSAAVR